MLECMRTFLCCFSGLEEEGLYRISGATSDIQRLKKTFEKSQLFSQLLCISVTATKLNINNYIAKTCVLNIVAMSFDPVFDLYENQNTDHKCYDDFFTFT